MNVKTFWINHHKHSEPFKSEICFCPKCKTKWNDPEAQAHADLEMRQWEEKAEYERDLRTDSQMEFERELERESREEQERDRFNG